MADNHVGAPLGHFGGEIALILRRGGGVFTAPVGVDKHHIAGSRGGFDFLFDCRRVGGVKNFHRAVFREGKPVCVLCHADKTDFNPVFFNIFHSFEVGFVFISAGVGNALFGIPKLDCFLKPFCGFVEHMVVSH